MVLVLWCFYLGLGVYCGRGVGFVEFLSRAAGALRVWCWFCSIFIEVCWRVARVVLVWRCFYQGLLACCRGGVGLECFYRGLRVRCGCGVGFVVFLSRFAGVL